MILSLFQAGTNIHSPCIIHKCPTVHLKLQSLFLGDCQVSAYQTAGVTSSATKQSKLFKWENFLKVK